MPMIGSRFPNALQSGSGGGGQTDPADQTANYNTSLPPQQEQLFQAWRARLPPNLQNMQDYDLRGAFLKNAAAASNGHLPDDYKKPNHPTFSDESIYSGPYATGGKWIPQPGGKWAFQATPDNLRYRDANALKDYFQQVEPGNALVLPPALNQFRFGKP